MRKEGEEEGRYEWWSLGQGVVEKRSQVWRVRSVNVVGEEQGEIAGKSFGEGN